MKRFLFAAALVALVTSVGTADEKTTGTTPVTAAPVVVTTAGTPVAEYAPAQSTQRRGLFGRLRNRNSSATAYSPTPVMTAPTMSATPMPAPSTAPQPMPMPGTRTGTSGAPAAPNMIVQASGDLPAGTYTTTDGKIVQIGGAQTAAEPMTETQSGRRGLFSRLRSR